MDNLSEKGKRRPQPACMLHSSEWRCSHSSVMFTGIPCFCDVTVICGICHAASLLLKTVKS